MLLRESPASLAASSMRNAIAAVRTSGVIPFPFPFVGRRTRRAQEVFIGADCQLFVAAVGLL
jgi:hypothetical protein